METEQRPFDPVLLVMEPAEAALRVAEAAADVAAAFRSRIVAVSVVDTETLRYLLRSNVLVHDEMLELERELGESAKHHLRIAAAAALDRDVPCEEVVLHGSWRQAVVDKQREIGAGLVVVGAFPFSMVRLDVISRAKRLIVESVSCPVLIVR